MFAHLTKWRPKSLQGLIIGIWRMKVLQMEEVSPCLVYFRHFTVMVFIVISFLVTNINTVRLRKITSNSADYTGWDNSMDFFSQPTVYPPGKLSVCSIPITPKWKKNLYNYLYLAHPHRISQWFLFLTNFVSLTKLQKRHSPASNRTHFCQASKLMRLK